MYLFVAGEILEKLFFLFSFPFFFELGFPSLLEDGGQFRIVNLTLISRRNFQDNLTQDEK